MNTKHPMNIKEETDKLILEARALRASLGLVDAMIADANTSLTELEAMDLGPKIEEIQRQGLEGLAQDAIAMAEETDAYTAELEADVVKDLRDSAVDEAGPPKELLEE